MRSRPGTRWRTIGLAVLGLAISGYLVTGLVIGRQVARAVSVAQSTCAEAPVAALIVLATADHAPLRERNRAIWALGQLGAGEALPALRSLQSNTACDHGATVCQHELQKAIDLCAGAFNAGALVWRHGELASTGDQRPK